VTKLAATGQLLMAASGQVPMTANRAWHDNGAARPRGAAKVACDDLSTCLMIDETDHFTSVSRILRHRRSQPEAASDSVRRDIHEITRIRVRVLSH